MGRSEAALDGYAAVLTRAGRPRRTPVSRRRSRRSPRHGPEHAVRRDRRERARPVRRAAGAGGSWRATRRCPGWRASSCCASPATRRARLGTRCARAARARVGLRDDGRRRRRDRTARERGPGCAGAAVGARAAQLAAGEARRDVAWIFRRRPTVGAGPGLSAWRSTAAAAVPTSSSMTPARGACRLTAANPPPRVGDPQAPPTRRRTSARARHPGRHDTRSCGSPRRAGRRRASSLLRASAFERRRDGEAGAGDPLGGFYCGRRHRAADEAADDALGRGGAAAGAVPFRPRAGAGGRRRARQSVASREHRPRCGAHGAARGGRRRFRRWPGPGMISRRSRWRTNAARRDRGGPGRRARRARMVRAAAVARARFTARGLEFDADGAIEAAAARPAAPGPLAARALSGDRGAAAARAGPRASTGGPAGGGVGSCGGNVEARVERMRARGDLAGAHRGGCARRCAWIRARRSRRRSGDLLSAAGRHDAALAEMSRLVAHPNDPQRRLRWPTRRPPPDSPRRRARRSPPRSPAGPTSPRCSARPARWACRCRSTTSASTGPRSPTSRRSAGRCTAPAVMVLDRAVMRISGRDGDDVDAPDCPRRQQGRRRQVGGDRDSAGAEILTAHAQARRVDARAQEIAGKETISAADVAIGDSSNGISRDARAVGRVRARVPRRSFLLPVVRRADGAQRAAAGSPAGTSSS